MQRSFENCFYLSSCLLSQRRRFRGIPYSNVTLNQTSGDISQYVLRSGSLWPPLSSSMPKNKRHVSLEIFKISVCFLSMTAQLGVANNHNNHIITKEWFNKSLQCQFFISNLNKYNNDKCLYHVRSVGQSWATL